MLSSAPTYEGRHFPNADTFCVACVSHSTALNGPSRIRTALVGVSSRLLHPGASPRRRSARFLGSCRSSPPLSESLALVPLSRREKKRSRFLFFLYPRLCLYSASSAVIYNIAAPPSLCCEKRNRMLFMNLSSLIYSGSNVMNIVST